MDGWMDGWIDGWMDGWRNGGTPATRWMMSMDDVLHWRGDTPAKPQQSRQRRRRASSDVSPLPSERPTAWSSLLLAGSKPADVDDA